MAQDKRGAVRLPKGVVDQLRKGDSTLDGILVEDADGLPFRLELTREHSMRMAELFSPDKEQLLWGSREPYLFKMMTLILPRRLWEEELGDALEVLHALRKSGAPGWQMHLKIFSTFAWGVVNALREVISAATGQARERE